jgi:hypothetical protein
MKVNNSIVSAIYVDLDFITLCPILYVRWGNGPRKLLNLIKR